MIFSSLSKYMLKYQKAKAKLVEYDVAHEDYPKFNRDSNTLVYSTIYILSKYAEGVLTNDESIKSEFAPLLISAAQYFDAAESSKDRSAHSADFLLSGASAYFFISDFGSAKVLNSKLGIRDTTIGSAEYLLKLIYDYLFEHKKIFTSDQNLWGKVYRYFIVCFSDTSSEESMMQLLAEYRREVYFNDDPYEIYCVDLLCAVITIAFNNSSWVFLPEYSDVPLSDWLPYLKSKNAISILWPSQQLICRAGILKGKSAIVQLPTGVGKTKSIELILRAAFLSNRANIAIIVAPLRALCNEITVDMVKAFNTSIRINQFSDVLQSDYEIDITDSTEQSIFICTPEKLSFIIHHQPEVIKSIDLFILDEGHMFDDGIRGARYEFLVSELKAALSNDQQIVLLSAVLSNADQIREWMFAEAGMLATNPEIKSTAKSIGFTSASKNIYYFSDDFSDEDFFIPKSIEITQLKKLKREIKTRFFPEGDDPKDIALYYAIRLCHNGGAAIYVNRVVSVASVINRVLELQRREYDFSKIQSQSDQAELEKLQNLISLYYGNDSVYAISCMAGVLPHYANLPNGIKLSIEDAFRHQRIRIVVCTSTLAQGVNIPIRYLFITEYRDRYSNKKIRDFQNLIGRTARSGMYTEGSIIITSPKLYDERLTYTRGGKYHWNEFVEQLNPESSEPCSSSILDSIRDFQINYQLRCEKVFETMLQHIASDNFVSAFEKELKEQLCSAFPDLTELQQREAFSVIRREVLLRKVIVEAIENHICFICSETPDYDVFEVSKNLCLNSLAFYLANETEKAELKELFLAIAKNLSELDSSSIVRVSKCAVGMEVAAKIESWLHTSNLSDRAFTEEELLDMIVPLFIETHSSEQLPSSFLDACRSWIEGGNLTDILRITGEDRLPKAENLCGNTISFELNFLIGNICDLYEEPENASFDPIPALQLLQRKIKYGVPTKTAASICEKVFNDQQLSIGISEIIGDREVDSDEIIGAILAREQEVIDYLEPFPTFFTDRIHFLSDSV